VFVQLPAGQASWHIHESELGWFDHLERRAGNSWDGHTTPEKYERLGSLEAGTGLEARLGDRLWGWQQDAAARLEQYCDLINSGLLGAPEQVRASLIRPTIAMLENDLRGRNPFDACDLCGAAIRPGARFAAVALGDEHDVGEACSKCAPEYAGHVKDEIDLVQTILRAHKALRDDPA
jgi:hypothetical protein